MNSKREDLDCCKRIKEIEYFRTLIQDEKIDCGEWYRDYVDFIEFLNLLEKESEMRCSEHCGNTKDHKDEFQLPKDEYIQVHPKTSELLSKI